MKHPLTKHPSDISAPSKCPPTVLVCFTLSIVTFRHHTERPGILCPLTSEVKDLSQRHSFLLRMCPVYDTSDCNILFLCDVFLSFSRCVFPILWHNVPEKHNIHTRTDPGVCEFCYFVRQALTRVGSGQEQRAKTFTRGVNGMSNGSEMLHRGQNVTKEPKATMGLNVTIYEKNGRKKSVQNVTQRQNSTWMGCPYYRGMKCHSVIICPLKAVFRIRIRIHIHMDQQLICVLVLGYGSAFRIQIWIQMLLKLV